MPIQIAIFEDHQGIIDGYLYRLNPDPEMEIVGTALYGENLEPLLASQVVDVLLLDIHLPTSPQDRSPFRIVQLIPQLIQQYPQLHILVISMSTQVALVQALVEAGVSGYIFKDDQNSIQNLASIVKSIAQGGIYFSHEAHRQLQPKNSPEIPHLSPRQFEILSICALQPDIPTAEIATRLKVADSTVRNQLSRIYDQFGVRTRAAAIAQALQLGLLPQPIFTKPPNRQKQ